MCESLSYRDWAGYYAVSAYEHHHEHEYNAIRNAAAVIDVSPLFKYLVSGPDAARLVDRLITRDVAKMTVGQVFYTPWCDESGHVIDDGTVSRLDEQLFRWTAADPSLRWFRQNAAGLRVNIEDVSEEIAALALQGPTSARVLRAASDADLDALKYFRVVTAAIGGVTVDISRTGYTGDLGYEIWMPAAAAIRVWDVLMDVGRPFDIKPAGMLALDVARVEAGLLLIDVDFFGSKKALIPAQKYTPFEMGLDRLVSPDKSRFIGQQALHRGASPRPGAPHRGARYRLDWDRDHLRANGIAADGRCHRVKGCGAGVPQRAPGRAGDNDDVVAGAQENDRARDRRAASLRRRNRIGSRSDGGGGEASRQRDRRANAVLQSEAKDRYSAGLESRPWLSRECRATIIRSKA